MPRIEVSLRSVGSIVGGGRVRSPRAANAAADAQGSVPSAPTFVTGPVFAGDNALNTDTITEQVTATGTGIIDYEFAFILNNAVIGTKTLTKAQAEASHAWAKTATATTFLMTYTDTAVSGPGYAFAFAGNAAARTASVSGVRVRARNASGYSAATFSVGTGQIVDMG